MAGGCATGYGQGLREGEGSVGAVEEASRPGPICSGFVSLLCTAVKDV